LRFRVKVRVRDRVKVGGNTFKYVFGQTSILASVLVHYEKLFLSLDR